MKKLLGSGLALAFAAAGTMLLASPGSAEVGGGLEATISPTEVTQGAPVTITGDACDVEGGIAEWGIFLESDPDDTPAFDGGTTPAAGGLNLTITAPNRAGSAAATYAVQVSCGKMTDSDFYYVKGSIVVDSDGIFDDGDNQFRFDVLPSATTTTVADTPTPAPAVPGRPNLTG